jgi:hypothetical protein
VPHEVNVGHFENMYYRRWFIHVVKKAYCLCSITAMTRDHVRLRRFLPPPE